MMIRRTRPRAFLREARYSVPQIAPPPEALIRKPISSELPWKTSRTMTGISVEYGAASSATTDSVSSSARIGSRFQL